MTANKPGDPLTLNRLYGRSSGHKLRKGQAELVDTLLPQIAVPAEGEVTAARLFGEDRPLHLEIGFGSGEHLADRADMLPDHGFIGCEPFLNGVATGARPCPRAAPRQRPLVARRRARRARPGARWRAVRSSTCSTPTPGPRRATPSGGWSMTARSTLFAAKLRPGGEFRLATDDPTYLDLGADGDAAARATNSNGSPKTPTDFLEPPGGWIETRYGAKARREGRRPYYLRYRARADPCLSPARALARRRCRSTTTSSPRLATRR